MRLLFAVIFSFITLSAQAFYEPTSTILPLRDRFKVITMQEQAISLQAQKLVAYLSLARQSVFFKMKKNALQDVTSAETEAKGLLTKAKGISHVPGIPLGKMAGEETDLYLPIWTADGVSEDVKMVNRFFKTRTVIKSANLVFVTMSLDMSSTLEHLNKAKEFLKKDDFALASKEMDAIIKEALISETDVTDPLLTVWANLSLAQEFLMLNDVSNARYTIKQVKKDLIRLEKDKILSKDSMEVKLLENDLIGIEDAIERKSPGLVSKGKEKIQAWKLKVKNWM